MPNKKADNKYLNVYGYNFSQEIKKKQMTEEIIQEKETREHPKIGSKKSVLEWRSAKTIRRAPDKTGNVNNSNPAAKKIDSGNNGIVFSIR